ncbi:metalloregulator ArsR/SmtB family transcription factor [Paraneptunicella aestuarii]|uniref:metalloregulator ArsR/SmtB family transcription factor n=1 Tax=Paraneptunicella aestuarii TaxID=2831148 RepID=UPI001E40B174|nr:metalloregulator ArsR/SmtB family transcription factor [Paraneptunicella aestuarii]UAA37663.1 metalloregulator ArsR/SmtB family transcription factor [Paraneptunicella aestuarii]
MKMQTEHFFRCLADPVRLNLVLLLMHNSNKGELCSCELAEVLNEKLSTVSRHLVLLRNKGIVKENRHELWLYYQMSDELPSWAQDILNSCYQGNQHRLLALPALFQGKGEQRLCS